MTDSSTGRLRRTWALLVWLKKFAEAYIGAGEGGQRRRPGLRWRATPEGARS